MPTQIIDNFELTSELPLDARLVVGPNAFYQTKDLIEYKYYGLRVWDFNFNLPFVWTGTTWSNENVGSALVSNGQGGYLPKFLGSGTSNTLSNSIIFDNGTGRIGIGTTSPLQKLDVSGNIKATQFYGNGSTITSINASNIVNGILNLGLLNTSGAGSNWLLAMNGTATWTNNFQLRVGSSKAIVIENETSSSNNFDLLFYQSTDIFAMDLANGTVANPYSYIPKSARTGNNRIQFKPQTGQLLFSNGNKTSPSISFRNSTGVGAYFDTDIAASYNGLTFTVNQNGGSKRLTVSAGGGVGNFGSNLILYSNTNDQMKLIITHLDNSDTYFSSYNQGNPGGSIYFTNQTLFRVESPTVLTSTLNVGTNLTTTGNSTTNNNMFVYQRAVIGGTNLDATSVNARLMVVANGTSGAALFTSNQWSAFGHQSTIYIGDSLHYIRSNYAGTFDIKSGDSIKLISGASTRVYLNNSSGNVGIGTESPTSRLTVNGNIRTDFDFVTGTDDGGWVYFVIPENGYFFSRLNNGTWNDVNYSNTAAEPFDRPHFRYKIIGKTALVTWRITVFNNNTGGGFNNLTLKLPPDLQNLKDQYNGATVKAQTDNGIASYRRSGPEQYGHFTVAPRQYSSGFPSTDWFLVFDFMGIYPSSPNFFVNVGSGAGAYAEYFIGSCLLEMN